jgi:hypothetical protein
MKLLLVWISGLVLGLLSAAAILYFNPLTDQHTVSGSAIVDSARLHYSTAGPDALAFTHGTSLPLEIHPPGVPALFEAALEKTALGTFLMTDDSGVVTAVASRISKLSSQTNLVTEGILLEDDWLLSVPGRGSYFVEAQSNVWPLLRATVVDVGLLRRAWSDRREFPLTIGPGIGETALVTGATGSYRDLVGSGIDRLALNGFRSLPELTGPIEGWLEVSLRSAAPAETSETTLSAAPQSP